MTSEPLAIDEQPVPLDPAVESLNPAAAVEDLIKRRSELEDQLEAERKSAAAAQRELLLGMLEVADALDRILRAPAGGVATEWAERVRTNLQATRRLMAQKLAAAGVRPMALTGQPADPRTADVERVEPRDDLADDTVLQEIIAGYWWGDAVLRRARVIVAQQP